MKAELRNQRVDGVVAAVEALVTPYRRWRRGASITPSPLMLDEWHLVPSCQAWLRSVARRSTPARPATPRAERPTPGPKRIGHGQNSHKKTTQAHVWYAQITKLIPKNGLKEILTKALLGQIFFGPLVTIVFFAAACAQGDGLSTLPAKIKADLLQVQIAGAGFWPFVDLISYAFIPIAYIPLFVNCASFVWTIFLSLKSRVGKK